MTHRFLAAFAALVWATSAQAQTAPALSMAGFPAVGSKPIVTVISSGEKPRLLPHQAPVAGMTEHMDMTMTMTIGMEVAGMTPPTVAAPPMIMGLDVSVDAIAANGDVTMSMAFTGVKAGGPSPDPSFDEMMRGLDAQLKTFKGTLTVGADGHLVSQNFALPATMPADTAKNFTDSLRNMTPPVPLVPMGVGGKWEVRTAVQSGGATLFQKTGYEILALDDASVTVKTSVEQTFPGGQTVANPQLPPGAEMTLESGTGSGGGTLTMRADSLVPSSDMTLKNTIRMRVSMNGQTQPIAVTTEIRIQMKKG